MNPKALIGVVAGLAVVGGVVALVIFGKKGDPEEKPATFVLELRAKASDPNSVIDPMNGAEMFQHNCVSCHGPKGEGDGPANDYLWRKPRNLSDGSYMNSRTDAQLKLIINEGGKHPEIQLSRLMPQWNASFNTLQQWDLVAWVRRLHPTIEDFVNAGDYVRYESVLSEARAAEVAKKAGGPVELGDHTVVFYAVWSTKSENRPLREDKPAPDPKASGLSGYVAFTQIVVEGQRISLGVAIDPSGKIHKAATFQKVVLLKGDGTRDDSSIDAFVKKFEGTGPSMEGVNVPPVGGREEMTNKIGLAVKKLQGRILAALEQDKEDWADIEAGKKAGAADSPGRKVWERLDCVKCHGPTGRAKGPGVAAREPLPANLANGAYMNALPDEYIFNVLDNGGPAMNISPVMPSYHGSMTKEEMLDLIKYIRTLAVPAKS